LLQRVRYDLNIGQWLILKGSDKVVIANSEITQGVARTSGYRGPLLMDECTNFVLANNTFTYALDGLNMNVVHEGVIENNKVYRDGTARYPSTEHLINHVLILNFAQNVAVLNNLFKVTNGPAQDVNDGEAIIAEGGGPDRIDEDAGTVSGATATTLQDNSKSWGSFRLKPVVAIVNGKGMGQWRSIVSRSGNTLTLDRPWDVVPTAGAHYAIFNWGSRNWLLQGNIMEGNHRGITLYENAMSQVAIVNNTLTNSGSIELSPYQTENSGRGVPQEFLPMYTNQIIGNSVANTNGTNGVFIGVHSTQYVQQRTFGTSVIGLEIRNNILTAGKPNIPAVVDDSYPEGYLNFLNFQQMPGQYYIDEQIPAILGTIFQNNKAINCHKAVYLNSGSYNTLVCNTQTTNVGSLLMDATFEKLSHGAVRTTYCLETATVLPPVADPKKNFPIPRNAGTTRLIPLSGSSPNGAIVSFTINKLPPTAQGTLYFNNKPANETTLVPANQADMLSFQPNTAYTGEAAFVYAAIDQKGMASSTADFIVPVINPLPVELIRFTVEPKGEDAELAWATASEINSDYFAVERSLDAASFTTVGIVHASGTTTNKQTYTFTDTGLGAQQKTIYYRLKQVDIDERATYSPVRSVTFAGAQAVAVHIYPNPTTSALRVLLPTAGAHLSVYSATGALLMHTRTDTAEANIDVTHLPAGVYPLLIQADKGEAIRQSFIKQ
ncbi:MAG: T9SS type A sorting domain-containing protein, partial [Hymenobacter sp.]